MPGYVLSCGSSQWEIHWFEKIKFHFKCSVYLELPLTDELNF